MSNRDKGRLVSKIEPHAARQVNINFNNFTSSELKLKGTSLEHGIFGSAPPQKISAGKVAAWTAESAGLLTGTEGYVWYEPVTGESLGSEFELYWNNPAIGSNSYNSVVKGDTQKLYSIAESGTAGNTSSVSFNVFEKSQNWSAASWMKGISDSTSIGRLTIPGTHESGATYSNDGDVFGVIICQEQTLLQQLNSGIRFLDIRCFVDDGIFYIYHGIVYQQINFGDVVKICREFLSNSPSETVLMRVKQENSQASNSEFVKIFNDVYYSNYKDIMYVTDQVPLLGDVRGKIVIISNVGTLPGIQWAKLHVQDNYDPSSFDQKVRDISTHLDSTISNHKNGGSDLFLNFISKQGIPLVQTISQAAEKLNPRTLNLIAEKNPPVATGLGIIAMDFPNRSGGVLQILVNSNFRIINESFYDISQNYVPRSTAAEKIDVSFTFATDDRPPSPGSKIHAVAPDHTKIIDMSRNASEVLSISPDGASADVVTKESTTPWGRDRTITLLVDAEAPEGILTGSLQYFSSDDNPGVRCEISIETYQLHLEALSNKDSIKPGGSYEFEYYFKTNGVIPPSGSKISITAPPYTKITGMSSVASESVIINADRKTADLVNPRPAEQGIAHKTVTLLADDDVPADLELYGSLQYFSSTDVPGSQCDIQVVTNYFYFTLRDRQFYVAPGKGIDIPFWFTTYDSFATPGSRIIVELAGDSAFKIADMSRKETEALSIAQDGLTAELVATDGSGRWDESRTFTVFCEPEATEGQLSVAFISYISAGNMYNGSVTNLTVTAAAPVPEPSAISANGYTFALDAGFPTTAFEGAEFSIELTGGSASEYVWTANVPWIEVIDGKVRFTRRGNLDNVTISWAPANGPGKTQTYSFTLKRWYCNNGDALMSFSEASDWAKTNPVAVLPSVLDLTGGTVESIAIRGKMGALWGEWGDLTHYSAAGFLPGNYWTLRPVIGTDDYYRVDLQDGRVIKSDSAANESYVLAIRASRWPE